MRTHGGATARRTTITRPAEHLRLGLLVPTRGYCFDQVVAGAKEAAHTSNCSLIIADYEYRETSWRDLYARIGELDVDAMLATPNLPISTWNEFVHSPVPTVLIERPWQLDWIADEQPERVPGISIAPVDFVHSNHTAGATLGLEHLRQLGHRRIQCIFRDTASSPALTAAAMEYRRLAAQRWQVDVEITALPALREGQLRTAVQTLVQRPDPPTALFVHTDADATEALDILARLGIAVPDQLALLSYDGALSSNESLGISDIAPRREWLGRRAVEMAAERLRSRGARTHPACPPVQVSITPELHVRRSTAG